MIGRTLSHYRITEKLGAGGMGEVYLAEDTGGLERTVALKVIPAELASDPQRMQRFAKEARAVSALNHPNILTVYEFGQEGETRFIASEYVEGETLRRYMSCRRAKLHELLDVAIQIAAALDAAHGKGVVHRDIKPENVMVRRDQIVKVLDFGLAKLLERAAVGGGHAVDTEAGTLALTQTAPGLVLGTVAYMSPEQSRDSGRVDARTDIWSLGVVLFEMVTGLLPFVGSDMYRQILAIQEEELEPLSLHVSGVPERLEEIVAKALAKDPDDRYQTAMDLLLDLKQLRRRLEIDAELDRSTPPEPERSEPPISGDAAEVARSASSAEYLVAEIGRHKRAVAVTLVVLALVSAAVAYSRYESPGGGAIRSIAVLPLVNASDDPDSEYLSDGIAESITRNLSQLPNLKVMARSSVFRFKGQQVDPQRAGRDLGVEAILVGRLLRHGERLVISAELVSVAEGTHLWGAEYDRKVSDALAVQREISREISETLRLRLTGDERERLGGHETSNPEAYRLFLKGRHHWNKRTWEEFERAIEQFRQAADLDPTYALAYVGLADCYALMPPGPDNTESEILETGRAYAERALGIDGSLAEAHASLGMINLSSWRWDDAGRELERAIELNPNYATAHHWHGIYLLDTGRFEESAAALRRARELDPLSRVIGFAVAMNSLRKGDLEACIEQSKQTIELEPDYYGGHVTLGSAYLRQGRYPEALAELKTAADLSPSNTQLLRLLGHGYAVAGQRAEALAVLRELKERYDRGEAYGGTDLAAVYLGLGERDQAFEWIEKDFRTGRFRSLVEFRRFWGFEAIRHDPRYADVLRRMGLSPMEGVSL